jgi:hypothetical protein
MNLQEELRSDDFDNNLAKLAVSVLADITEKQLPNSRAAIDFLASALRQTDDGTGLRILNPNSILPQGLAIVYGPEAMLEISNNPSIEKNLQLIGRIFGGREGIMGNRDSHLEYSDVLENFIKETFTPSHLREVFPNLMSKWFIEKKQIGQPFEVSINDYKKMYANIVLEKLFPDFNWSKENITSTIAVLEALAPVASKVFVENIKGRKENEEEFMQKEGIKETTNYYKKVIIDNLYANYLTKLKEGNQSHGIFAALARKFESEDGTIPEDKLGDVQANIVSFVSAAYETVATSLIEISRALAKDPILLRDIISQFNSVEYLQIMNTNPLSILSKINGTSLEAAIYHGVRVASPLPAAARAAVESTNIRGKEIQIDTRILVLLRSVLTDPKIFANPHEVTGTITAEEKFYARRAFGAGGSRAKDDFYCLGYGPAQFLLLFGIEHLVKNFKFVGLKDAPLVSYGAVNQRDRLVLYLE